MSPHTQIIVKAIALFVATLCFCDVGAIVAPPKGGMLYGKPPTQTTTEDPIALPIASIIVSAEIVDFLASVTVAQKYKNAGSTPLTAEYRFPLDNDAAVTGFTASIGDRVVVAKIEELEQAKKDYQDAINKNQTAFLLQSITPDVFSMSIGNVPPDQTAVIKITYVTKLTMVEGPSFFRFYIPSANIDDRYAPSVPGGTTAGYQGTQLNSPIFISVNIQVPYSIQTISSPSYAPVPKGTAGSTYILSVEIQSEIAQVHFLAPRLDKDFALVIQQQQPYAPRMWIETHPVFSSRMAMLAYSFSPNNVTKSFRSEIIFVVDTSGSMAAGTRIPATKSALHLFLDSLEGNIYFNIVRFSSDYSSVFPTSQQATTSAVLQAKRWVDTLSAEGGTEMWNALQFVLDSPFLPAVTEATKRILIVTTDGEVSNTDYTVSQTSLHRRGAFIFTLGIGSSASHNLMDGLARVGEGVAEYAQDGESINDKVMRMVSRAINQEVHSNVKISWDLGNATTTNAFVQGRVQTPAVIPPVYTGVTTLAYKMLNAEETCNSETGLVISAPDSWKVAVACDKIRRIQGDVIHRLAVRSRIRDLEELPSRSAADKTEIIGLSKAYNISSSLTAFIAIMANDNDTALAVSPPAPSSTSGSSPSSSSGGAPLYSPTGRSMSAATSVAPPSALVVTILAIATLYIVV